MSTLEAYTLKKTRIKVYYVLYIEKNNIYFVIYHCNITYPGSVK